jgi:hypothetical protein
LAQPERQFALSPDDIARINPNTKTAPVFRARGDADLTSKIYAHVPVLIDESKGAEGNPWSISFHTRIWHMAEDSAWFRTAARLLTDGFRREDPDWIGDERCVPLYEAKMIHQFDHRWATYDGAHSRDATLAEKQDPAFESSPRYWVPEGEVHSRLASKGWSRGWLMGWRDICRSTDERTLIADLIPATGSGDKFLLLFPTVSVNLCSALLANMNALVCDYVVRQKIGGTSLKLYLIQQIPILLPATYSDRDLAFIASRVLELTYTSHSMAPLARDLGYEGPPFAWNEGRRALLRAELDAWYARAYGLSRDELRYILDPADVMGADYPSETFRVLKNNEIRQFGEYRTARLVLNAWDQMERGEFPAVSRPGPGLRAAK